MFVALLIVSLRLLAAVPLTLSVFAVKRQACSQRLSCAYRCICLSLLTAVSA